jgi:hypothetical protein
VYLVLHQGFIKPAWTEVPILQGLIIGLINLISRKVTGGQTSYGFVFSEELKNKNLNNNQFLTVMYIAFFDRLADKSIYLLIFSFRCGQISD